MKKNTPKKSLEKSNNLLEQKRKNGQAKILQKKHARLTASNFVREQLKTSNIARTLIEHNCTSFKDLRSQKNQTLKISQKDRLTSGELISNIWRPVGFVSI